MKIIASDFKVVDLNIDGILKISSEYELVKVENPVEHYTQWQIAVGVPLGFLIIDAIYRQKSKLDLTDLCVYKINIKYTIALDHFNNEDDVIKEICSLLYNKMADGYNERIVGTKQGVPFPQETEETRNHFCQQISRSLHKALERIR